MLLKISRIILQKCGGIQRLETMKRDLQLKFGALKEWQLAMSSYKSSYYASINKQRHHEATINSLLQRKSQWTPHYIEHFTKSVFLERQIEDVELS